MAGISIFLLVDFAPLVPLLVIGKHGRWLETILLGLFNIYSRIDPAVICVMTYVCIHSVNKTRPDSTSLLSIIGIISQILIHTILPIFWLGLIRVPFWVFLFPPWNGFAVFYELYGWVLLDNAFFAVLQGRLLWMALRQRKAMAVGKGRITYLDLKANSMDT